MQFAWNRWKQNKNISHWSFLTSSKHTEQLTVLPLFLALGNIYISSFNNPMDCSLYYSSSSDSEDTSTYLGALILIEVKLLWGMFRNILLRLLIFPMFIWNICPNGSYMFTLFLWLLFWLFLLLLLLEGKLLLLPIALRSLKLPPLLVALLLLPVMENSTVEFLALRELLLPVIVIWTSESRRSIVLLFPMRERET